ncbi:MAG: hypothetical protein V3S41_00780 [Spirochaetia bacterium]
MHLFLIAAAPLSYVYTLILRDEAGEPQSLVGVSALRGMPAYLIELAIILLLGRFAPRVYSGYRAYFSSVLYDFGIPILGTFLLYLWFTPNVRGLSSRERRLSLLSFIGGAFTLAGVMDIFLRAEYFGMYELFLLPALRVTAMLLVPIFYLLFVEETFWIRGLYIVTIVALPFVFAGVFFLVVLNVFVAAILAGAVGFSGAWLVTILGSRTGAGRRR